MKTEQHITIAANLAGIRLDNALALALGTSRNQIQRRIRAGLIQDRSGGKVDPSHITQVDEIFTIQEPAAAPIADIPDLQVLYEDADVLVVDKPAGLVVHSPESGRVQPTVAAFAAARGVVDEDPDRPGIVHRLDKDTSGVMVLAKHPKAKAFLQQQFKQRTVKKSYLALVKGRLPEAEAVIQLPIGRHRRQPVRRAVVSGARAAVTHYRTLRQYPGYTLVEVDLQTGRTHQIRVHFAHIGHAVAGDVMYGEKKRPAGLPRQFLHAAQLTFTTPAGKVLTFESPVPADLAAFLQDLEKQV